MYQSNTNLLVNALTSQSRLHYRPQALFWFSVQKPLGQCLGTMEGRSP